MRLFDNNFEGYREIDGYSQEEILRIKNSITELKSDNTKTQELDTFLKSEFISKVNDSFLDYFKRIKAFSENYLFSHLKKDYFSLKKVVLNELKLISRDLTNLSSNGRNVKRIIKNNIYLDEFLNTSKELISNVNEFLPRLEEFTEKP